MYLFTAFVWQVSGGRRLVGLFGRRLKVVILYGGSVWRLCMAFLVSGFCDDSVWAVLGGGFG